MRHALEVEGSLSDNFYGLKDEVHGKKISRIDQGRRTPLRSNVPLFRCGCKKGLLGGQLFTLKKSTRRAVDAAGCERGRPIHNTPHYHH